MDADKGAGSTLNVANIRCSTMLRGLHTRLPCLYYRAPLRAPFTVTMRVTIGLL